MKISLKMISSQGYYQELLQLNYSIVFDLIDKHFALVM